MYGISQVGNWPTVFCESGSIRLEAAARLRGITADLAGLRPASDRCIPVISTWLVVRVRTIDT